MQSKFFKRMLSVLLAVTMVVALASGTILTNAKNGAADGKSNVSFTKVANNGSGLYFATKEAAKEFEDNYVIDGQVRVSIVLEDKPVLAMGYSTKNIAANTSAVNYSNKLHEKQDAIASRISREILGGEELNVVWNLTLSANIISAYVPYNKIEAIKNMSGVKNVVVEAIYELTSDDANMATASAMTGTPAVWAEGYTGAGSIIAIVDTGLDYEHELFDPEAFEHSIEQTGRNVTLLTADDIDDVIDLLHITKRLGNVSGEDLYVNSKVPFGANYVDNNLNIIHMNDTQGGHGSHVAGIAAGNSYVSDGEGGFVKALDAVGTQGQAPDAQLLIMKVFGAAGGAYDSDEVAAIEDAIMLGADSVNLSLGTAVAGFATSEVYQDIFESFTETDTVVVISSGNNSFWAEQTAYGHLYAEDVNYATNGSPGSYGNALTVASVDNGSYVYIDIETGKFLVNESSGFGNDPFSTLVGDQEYIMMVAEFGYYEDDYGEEAYGVVAGYGGEDEFAELGEDLIAGKILICSRGQTSFYEKVNLAAEYGAVGVIIYNNTTGTISMNLTGIEYTIPAVSVTQETGYALMANADDFDFTDSGLMYVTGELGVAASGEGDTLMSSFSSWGVPGDLSLKPEISAPGGDIYSVYGDNVEIGSNGRPVYVTGHDNYVSMSGTSMAAPQVTGLAAVMGQFIRENGLTDKLDISARKLITSLLMSTAAPKTDLYGDYYPVMQQGAGLANIEAALSAKSYITVDEVAETAPLSAAAAIADGKVKVELGAIQDDAFDAVFSIHNFSDEDISFYLNADLFTQYMDGMFRYEYIDAIFPILEWTVDGEPYEPVDRNMYDFNGDGVANALDAQHLLNWLVDYDLDLNGLEAYADFNGDEDIDSYDARLAFEQLSGAALTLGAGETVQIVLTVSGLEEIFGDLLENGLAGNYIEGYIFVREGDSEDGALGVEHSITVFGFWGDWSAASMFDKYSFADVLATPAEEEEEEGDEEELVDYPYMYVANGEDAYYMQAFLVKYPGSLDSYYFGGNPLVDDDIYMPERNALNSSTKVKSALYSLIRNAGATRFIVTNKYGKTVYEAVIGSEYAAYYYPSSQVWRYTYSVTALNFVANMFSNGDSFTLSYQAIPEYYIDADGTPRWDDVDAEGTMFSYPVVLDDEAPFIVGATFDEDTEELVLSAHDNQYIAAVALYTADEQLIDVYGSVEGVRKGEQINYPFDLEGISADVPYLFVEVYDYAMNLTTYRINLNAEELIDPELSVEVYPETATIVNRGSVQLSAIVYPWGYEDQTVYWTSEDEDIAVVDENGIVRSVYNGDEPVDVKIYACSAVDETKIGYATITVKVIHNELNAVIVDENGYGVGEFDIADASAYTKLTDEPLSENITTMAYGPDGKLYAAAFYEEDYTSDFFMVDPETFELTYIGYSEAGIIDMTMAPALGNYMYSVYGTYVLVNSVATGTYEGVFDMADYGIDADLVGIAYDYTSYNRMFRTYIDFMFAVDSDGYLYQFGFGIYGNSPTLFALSGIGYIGDGVDASFYQSLYYDEAADDLYWARYNPDDEQVELIMIDDVYTEMELASIGTFGAGVFPVGGMFQFKETEESGDDGNAVRPVAEAEVMGFAKSAAEFDKNKAFVSSVPALKPVAETQKTLTQVTVQITAEELSKNGYVRVLIPNTATLVKTETKAQYYSEILDIADYGTADYTNESDAEYLEYRFAFVDLDGIAADDAIVTLYFEMGSTGTLVIYTSDINEDDAQMVVETVILGVYSAEHEVHTYAAEWNWYQEDNGDFAATATLNCTLDDGAPEIVLDADVEKVVCDDHIEYVGTVEVDGKEFTDTYSVGIARINGRSANFGSELGINFLLKISDEITADEDAYAVVTFNGVDYKYTLADCISGARYKITKSFDVKEFRDAMVLHVYDGEGNLVPLYDKEGNDVTANGYTFSMQAYIDLAVANSTNEKMVALALAFQDYGAAAMIKFNYNADNVTLSDNVAAVTLADVAKYAPVYNDTSLETVTGDTATVTYSAKFLLNKYFTFAKGTDVSGYKFYVNGDEVTATPVSATKYLIEVQPIELRHYDDAITFTVSDGTNSYEVEYSVLSYVYKALESDKATAPMVNLAKAMYLAYVAADEYFK